MSWLIPKPSSSSKLIYDLTSTSYSSYSSFSSDKLESLYEVTYLPEDDKISVTNFHLVNPYHIFSNPTSSITKIGKQIFGPNTKLPVKEFIQTSRFDQFQIPAGFYEQFSTIAFPDNFART